MPVCPKCRLEFERGATGCVTCDVPLLDIVQGRSSGNSRATSSYGKPVVRATESRFAGLERRAPDSSEPVGGGRPEGGPGDHEGRAAAQALPAENTAPTDDRLLLLLEEPLPEIAQMICEFLENCGIRCVVQSESIGLLYRLPAPGAPISRARVFVLESDYQEARELVAHFFDRT